MRRTAAAAELCTSVYAWSTSFEAPLLNWSDAAPPLPTSFVYYDKAQFLWRIWFSGLATIARSARRSVDRRPSCLGRVELARRRIHQFLPAPRSVRTAFGHVLFTTASGGKATTITDRALWFMPAGRTDGRTHSRWNTKKRSLSCRSCHRHYHLCWPRCPVCIHCFVSRNRLRGNLVHDVRQMHVASSYLDLKRLIEFKFSRHCVINTLLYFTNCSQSVICIFWRFVVRVIWWWLLKLH